MTYETIFYDSTTIVLGVRKMFEMSAASHEIKVS